MGIDIDRKGVEFLKDNGISQVIVSDISNTKSISEIEEKEFDVVVLGELMEHLSNPGEFLQNLKTVISWDRTVLVVTVPNAFWINNFITSIFRYEFVHPDHNCWFSYRTIKTLLEKYGYHTEEIYYYNPQLDGLKKLEML